MIFLIDIGTIEDYPDYPFQLQVGVATPDGAVEASTNTTAFFGVDPNGGGHRPAVAVAI